MGLFDFFKKEIYLNRLVLSYRDVHMCSDMEAIGNLRQYSAKDLKEIVQILKKEESKGSLSSFLAKKGPTIFPL